MSKDRDLRPTLDAGPDRRYRDLLGGHRAHEAPAPASVLVMVAAVAALTGSLDDFAASHLIRLVSRGRRSGTLNVLGSNQPVVVCFDQGEVTYAGPADLGAARAALLSTGLISSDQWDEDRGPRAQAPEAGTRAHPPAPGGRAAGGLVRPAGQRPLDEALHDLAVNTVFELLLPSTAPFWFDPAVSHRLAGAQSLDAELLLDDAAARLQAWRLIADVIPSTSVVVRLADLLPPGTERVWLDREEWPVLAAIDGRRDVAAIIDHTGLSAFGVCGVLHRLMTLGVAEPRIDG